MSPHKELKKNPKKEGVMFREGIKLKETDSGDYLSFFVSSPDPDEADLYSAGTGNPDLPDVILDQQSIVDQINSCESPDADLVSLRHDRDAGPVARSVEAKLKEHPKTGKMSAWVKVLLDKTHSKYEDVKHKVKEKFLKGSSLEFKPLKTITGIVNGIACNIIEAFVVKGVGLAAYPVNPQAIGEWTLKEFNVTQHKEDKMKEEKKQDKIQKKEKKVDKPIEAKASEPKIPSKLETKEAKEFEEFKRMKKIAQKEKRKEEIKKLIDKEVKAKYKEAIQSKSPLINTGPQFEMNTKGELVEKEVLAWKEAVEKNIPIDMQYKEAAKLINKHPEIISNTRANPWSVEEKFIQGNQPQNWEVDFTEGGQVTVGQVSQANAMEAGSMGIKEVQNPYPNRLKTKEFLRTKTLTVPTNYSGDSVTTALISSTYDISPAELNDIFQPILINQLNDSRNIWATMRKVDFSTASQIQFRARVSRNDSQAAGAAENVDFYHNAAHATTAYWEDNVGRVKLQQNFTYYYNFVKVTGPEIALAQSPGGMGDIYADEIKWSMEDFMRKIELAIVGTGDGTSETIALGWEILGIATGNLYGRDRVTAYTTLQGTQSAQGGAQLSLESMRTAITTVIDNGANEADLAFFCRRTQQDKLRAILQELQRIVPTSFRAGFTGKPEIDGIPVFDSVNLNTDDLFLIDLKHTLIGIKVAPTVEELGRTQDARQSFIKMYWNQYCTAPNHNYWLQGLAT